MAKLADVFLQHIFAKTTGNIPIASTVMYTKRSVKVCAFVPVTNIDTVLNSGGLKI
jgi:hypothetical protein